MERTNSTADPVARLGIVTDSVSRSAPARPPAELAALWRIEGHLRNINHGVIFLALVATLWLLVSLAPVVLAVLKLAARP